MSTLTWKSEKNSSSDFPFALNLDDLSLDSIYGIFIFLQQEVWGTGTRRFFSCWPLVLVWRRRPRSVVLNLTIWFGSTHCVIWQHMLCKPLERLTSYIFVCCIIIKQCSSHCNVSLYYMLRNKENKPVPVTPLQPCCWIWQTFLSLLLACLRLPSDKRACPNPSWRACGTAWFNTLWCKWRQILFPCFVPWNSVLFDV